MRVEYTPNGALQVNLESVLQQLNADEKMHLIDVLACRDSVIKCVVDQIFEGLTEHGSRGGILHYARANPDTGLDYAMRQVALRADEVAKKEIQRLQDALASKTEELDEHLRVQHGRYL